MTPNLIEEYKRYCQWEYDIIKDLPKGQRIATITYEEAIINKINRIRGAGKICVRLIKVINGGESIKTDDEREEIRNIYENFKQMLKNLLTNDK